MPVDIAATDGGRLAFLGETDPPYDGLGYCGRCSTPFAARFLPGGRFDPDFGRHGVARLPGVFGPRRGAVSNDLLLLLSGKVLVAGIVEPDEVVLGRLGPGGDPDVSFGGDGVVRFRPCRGTPRRQRRAGCLPSARGELRVRSTPRGAALHLEIRRASDWASIGSLEVRPPRSAEIRDGQVARAKFSYLDDRGVRRRGSAQLHDENFFFKARAYADAEGMSLNIPPGVLRWKDGIGEPWALKVTVGFRLGVDDGGEQTLVLRRPG